MCIMAKKEIDERVIRMWTKEGFIELFWEEIAKRSKEDPENKPTYEQVFDELNQLFYDAVGRYRYADYKSFRMRMYENKKRR